MTSDTALPPARKSGGHWRYHPIAVALHWTIAALLTLAAALGWYMMSVEHEPGSEWYFDTHKSLGLVIALFVMMRVSWRLTHRPAPLPPHVPRWQARLAAVTQFALYGVIFALPVTGYLGASHTKSGVAFFGAATPHWQSPTMTPPNGFSASIRCWSGCWWHWLPCT